MIKKGILLAAFGTTYNATEEKCITPMIRLTEKMFPDYKVSIAYTSTIVIKKLVQRNRNISLPLEEAEKMLAAGIKELIVQPLHFMKGHEFDKKIVEPLESVRTRFEKFSIGNPLLSEEQDFLETAEVIRKLSLSVNNEKILLMGHGTDHPEDRVYGLMQESLYRKKVNAEIATVEGGITFEDALERIKKTGTEKVHLFPFMLVAGDHASNDMAGDDDDSWRNRLLQEGIQGVPHLQGLGESEQIREMFICHIKACMKQQ